VSESIKIEAMFYYYSVCVCGEVKNSQEMYNNVYKIQESNGSQEAVLKSGEKPLEWANSAEIVVHSDNGRDEYEKR